MDWTVFGLQRSGTNYLESLIKKSVIPKPTFRLAYEHEGVWKHAFDIPYDIETKRAKRPGTIREGHGAHIIETYDYWIARLREVNAVLITKHPFTWIDSVRRKNIDMKRFQKYDKSEDAHMYAEIYRDHALFWLEQMRHQNIYHIRYEELLADKKHYLTKIGEHFDVECEPFAEDLHKVSMSKHFKPEDRDKYIKCETNLTTEQQKEVIKIISKDILVNGYGYRL